MLVGLLVLIVVLLLLLAIPISIAFRIGEEQSHKLSLTVELLFGLVKVKHLPTSKKRDKRKHASSKKERKRGSGAFSIRLVRQPAFRRRLIELLSNLFQAIKRKDVALRVRLGFDDPASTGMLWGIVGPIAAWLGDTTQSSISVEPEFYEDVLEIDGGGELYFTPLKLVYLLAAFGLSPVVWKSFVHARQRSS